MSALKKIASHLLPCATGAVSGLVVVLSLSGSAEPPRPDVELRPVLEPTRAPDPAPGSDQSARVGLLERGLARVVRRLDAIPEPVSGDLPPEVEADRQSLREQANASWRDELEQHAREAVDPSWSDHAEARFYEDLDAMAGDGAFRTVVVDCRSESCTAEVEFETFGAATRGFVGLLTAEYSENCGTKTVLDDPLDPAEPYRATILYDCSEAKAQRALGG